MWSASGGTALPHFRTSWSKCAATKPASLQSFELYLVCTPCFPRPLSTFSFLVIVLHEKKKKKRLQDPTHPLCICNLCSVPPHTGLGLRVGHFLIFRITVISIILAITIIQIMLRSAIARHPILVLRKLE